MGAEGELYYSFRVAFAISVSTMRFLEWQPLAIIILDVAYGWGYLHMPEDGTGILHILGGGHGWRG